MSKTIKHNDRKEEVVRRGIGSRLDLVIIDWDVILKVHRLKVRTSHARLHDKRANVCPLFLFGKKKISGDSDRSLF